MQFPESNFDAWLDDQLRAVPLPEGFVERLRWAALVDDDDFDEAIRDVPVPKGLITKLQRQPKKWISLSRLARMATAASLLIGIGVSYIGAMVLFVIALSPQGVAPTELAAETDRVEIIGEQLREVELVMSRDVADEELLASIPQGSDPVLPVSVPMVEQTLSFRGPSGDIMRLFEQRDDRASTFATLDRWGVFGSHHVYDELDELEKVPGLTPKGIAAPRVEGFPLSFLLRFGVHPVVSPAANPALEYSEAPLINERASYELTQRYLNDGMLPDADVVRTEEFLAAMDYRFPEPKRNQSLSLYTAGGPSPFGGENLRLLQVGVRAASFKDSAHRPANLVFAIDVSTSMQWGGRIDILRSALGEMIDHLGPEDRISIVTFSDDAHLLLEDVGREDADLIRKALDMLAAEDATNVGDGLREAFVTARAMAFAREADTRVVLLTDGLAELDRSSLFRVHGRVEEAADRGIKLDVIDLGQDGEPDRQLQLLADTGKGKLYRATNSDGTRWAMLESLTGKPQLVASKARVRVVFNPKVVVGYRLLGHEAKALAGLLPAEVESDLYSDQSSTLLYEIQLKDGGKGEVASAELTWLEPDSGESKTIARRVNHGQFGSSFVESPLSLQTAAIAAQFAEILRLSPFVNVNSPVKPLDHLMEVVEQTDTELQGREAFAEFVSMIEKAQTAKPYRSGARR